MFMGNEANIRIYVLKRMTCHEVPLSQRSYRCVTVGGYLVVLCATVKHRDAVLSKEILFVVATPAYTVGMVRVFKQYTTPS